jgi:glutamate-1-semialdehyde 2,1-aminomutase
MITLTDQWANSGAKLYEKAKRVIPGGTQLLSKRPELFLPDHWPAYYSRAKGCSVWDLDGREFIDMTTTGIGACLLGYADDEVNNAAKSAIDHGTLTSLNSPQEVELAELLCQIHPWAHMVRYARTGGEAMAVAVRIARASSDRDIVAVCGYHGWADWYVAANLGDDAKLDGHLLPGLQPTGVPRALHKTVLPFHYNQIEQLESIITEHGDQLGAIVMEPLRFEEPQDGFLEKVRSIADRHNIVLVFDEITSGWRHNCGGVHLDMGVNPDIAVFAKSISNGFPMAAIIGRRDVMQAAQDSFISSTYWTESVGPITSLATIRKMRQADVPAHTKLAGSLVQEGLRRLSEKHSLAVHANGRPALTHIGFDYGDDSQAVKTLYTQYMLDRGYLAGPAFYPTLAHTRPIIDGFLDAADEVFAGIAQAVSTGGVMSQLRGPVAHDGFRRLA